MMSDSDFSVLLAVYKKDNPTLFDMALNSIFNNTLKPLEVVVVADGELGDDLLSVISSHSDGKQLRLIQLQKNVGLAKALNVGLSTIKTTFTIRADSDDFNYPDRFNLLVNKLREGFDLVGSNIREVDADGFEVSFRNCPLSQEKIKSFASRRNPFNHMSVAYRTFSVVESGGYPSIHLKEDYALWATLISKGCKVCNLDNVLVDATAGHEMFRRRGGLRYAMAEIELQQHLVKCNLKNSLMGLIDGVLRSIIFLSPNSLRQFFYMSFLRSRKGKNR